MLISEIKSDVVVSGVYLVKSASKSMASTGNSYLNIVLGDNTGTIEAKKWDIEEDDLSIFVAGNIVSITGEGNLHKDKVQLIIKRAFKVDEKDIDITNLIVESPIPINELKKSFEYYFNLVKDEELKIILKEVFENNIDKYNDYPAAVSNHHDFYHGLLFHSISMCKIAESIMPLYEGINKDLVITGCLLHDIGKIIEFSGPVATKYTIEGNMLGHISIGHSIVKEIIDKNKLNSEKTLALENIILSHHGKYEFGSPVLPKTIEAQLVSMIDDLDSKMMTLQKAYKNTKDGEFTEKIFSFDNRSFYKLKK